uniref:Protein kinase D3 n=1 Tax=Ornithorhynchus anatinus TaxID=9258 RepID=A0A6I8P9P3_ORNAN
MSANNSPPSSQKSLSPASPLPVLPAPSPSSSPQTGLSARLSNGSFSTQSLTNSRGSVHGISFLLQIGLTRESVTIETQELSLSTVKDLVCSIVYQKLGCSGLAAHQYLSNPTPVRPCAGPKQLQAAITTLET